MVTSFRPRVPLTYILGFVSVYLLNISFSYFLGLHKMAPEDWEIWVIMWGLLSLYEAATFMIIFWVLFEKFLTNKQYTFRLF
jgi:hypothetical protein